MTETSSKYGELIKGVGVNFKGMKKKKPASKPAKKGSNKGKKAYYTYE